jgi:DHA1 family bicyclomycin/chloramphenicol resistance-like MFS transporter
MAASTDVDVKAAETPEGESKPPSRVRMIAVLGALVALGPLTIDMYLPALPKIAEDLSVSSSVAQLTLTGTLTGLALGQLIVGPLSDSLGRRRPMMAGIVLHMLASVICLFAPNITVLGVARGLQGMGAAAAMVVAIAVVGDLYADSAAATVMSRLMLVLGVAPVIAPSLGAVVLLKASWHWVFAALVVLAGGLLLLAALALPETLPVSHRRPLKVRSIAATYVELLRDMRFVILVLVAALGMSGLFAYIAGASFVLQGHYGLDQQAFALVFGAGAVALIGATQFNVVLLHGSHRRRSWSGRWRLPCLRVWSSSACHMSTSAVCRGSWCRSGPSWPRWGSSFPTPPRWRCPGIPTLRAPRPRCSVRPSSAWALPWRRWSACSATTRSR